MKTSLLGQRAVGRSRFYNKFDHALSSKKTPCLTCDNKVNKKGYLYSKLLSESGIVRHPKALQISLNLDFLCTPFLVAGKLLELSQI